MSSSSTVGRRLAGAALRRGARLLDRGFRSALQADPGAPSLLLSPHLDDAALNCWSVLTSSERVTVVTVFAGVPAAGTSTQWDRIVRAPDSAKLLHERRAEDLAVLTSIGRSPVHLDLIEEQHRPYRSRPTFRRLDGAVRARVPAVSRVLAPMSLGTQHPDHLLLRQYALALRSAGVPVTLYADVPYASVYGWPAWVTGAERDPHLDVDAYWAPTLPTSPPLPQPRVVVLPPAAAAQKLDALRRYRTQFASLDRGPLHQLSHPSVHPYEVFWDLPA